MMSIEQMNYIPHATAFCMHVKWSY